MRKYLLVPLVALVVGVLAFSPAVFAWTYDLSGSVECVAGEQVVTWTVTNPEDETLTIQKSNRPVVPVGSTVPANDSENFVENFPGDQVGVVVLTIKGNFPSDQQKRQRTAEVVLPDNCEAPEQPPETPPVEQPKVTPAPQPTPSPVVENQALK